MKGSVFRGDNSQPWDKKKYTHLRPCRNICKIFALRQCAGLYVYSFCISVVEMTPTNFSLDKTILPPHIQTQAL